MTGASVHFKPVHNAFHAVSHSARTMSPKYLLKEKSLGTLTVIDDGGLVKKTLEAKLAIASRQALRVKEFSPVWEGVINLRRPTSEELKAGGDSYKEELADQIKAWCKEYEKLSKHKVLRADVHLDEGHIDENGKLRLNAHAHVIADRTDENGRVHRLLADDLRKIQTMTSKITGLEHGRSSKETKRKHISHYAYRHLAERGRLQAKREVDALYQSDSVLISREQDEKKALQERVSELTKELDELKKSYAQERKNLIASGEAAQADYQKLKLEFDTATAGLKVSIAAAAVAAADEKKALAALAATEKKLAAAESSAAAATTANQGELQDAELRAKSAEARAKTLNDAMEKIKTGYLAERKELIASKQATQADYQKLKLEYQVAVRKIEELGRKLEAAEANTGDALALQKALREAQNAQRGAETRATNAETARMAAETARDEIKAIAEATIKKLETEAQEAADLLEIPLVGQNEEFSGRIDRITLGYAVQSKGDGTFIRHHIDRLGDIKVGEIVNSGKYRDGKLVQLEIKGRGRGMKV